MTEISATGTPSASTYLRGDGAWSAVTATPGGANTSVQYNNGGVLGGFGTWNGSVFAATAFAGQYSNALGSAFINPDGSAAFGAGGMVITNTGALTATTLTLPTNTNQINLGTTNVGTISMATLSAARAWTFPNNSGTVMLLSNIATMQNKIVDNTNTVTLSDSLFTVQDNGDATKQFKVELSGVTTGTTVGPALVVAASSLAAQTAALGATTIYAVPAGGAGLYEVIWGAHVTTAATSTSTLGGTTGLQVRYTKGGVVKTTLPASVTNYTSTGNTTATAVGLGMLISVDASTNIQILFGYVSTGATPMAYSLDTVIKKVG